MNSWWTNAHNSSTEAVSDPYLVNTPFGIQTPTCNAPRRVYTPQKLQEERAGACARLDLKIQNSRKACRSKEHATSLTESSSPHCVRSQTNSVTENKAIVSSAIGITKLIVGNAWVFDIRVSRRIVINTMREPIWSWSSCDCYTKCTRAWVRLALTSMGPRRSKVSSVPCFWLLWSKTLNTHPFSDRDLSLAVCGHGLLNRKWRTDR